ncbi:MAG: hypothetical protein II398_10800 [Prevotella sp.]|nr:hypothetical protein [Prevotella sp.]
MTIIFCAYLIAQEVYNICKPYSRLDSKLQNINDTLSLLVDTVTDEFHDVQQKQDIILGDTMVLKAYFNNLLERFDNITNEGGTLQQQLNDLHVNVKGNYLTLDRQQEDIGYIKMRINDILSLMHPAHEIINKEE